MNEICNILLTAVIVESVILLIIAITGIVIYNTRANKQPVYEKLEAEEAKGILDMMKFGRNKDEKEAIDYAIECIDIRTRVENYIDNMEKYIKEQEDDGR